MKVLPKPESIWKYMLAVTQIPRGSNGEGEHFRHLKITSFLKERAEELNCQTYIDKGENLIIRKAAFPGGFGFSLLLDRMRGQIYCVPAVPHGHGC